MDFAAISGIIGKFKIEGTPVSFYPKTDGHINNTYAVVCESCGAGHEYILQSVNTGIFKRPDEVMQNIVNVTRFLKEKIAAAGGDPAKETLNVIYTHDDRFSYVDGGAGSVVNDSVVNDGAYWRVYDYVSGATAHQSADSPGLLGSAAEAFGRFQNMLSDYPADTLYETIPNFHNTPARLADFRAAVAADTAGRAAGVRGEIDFILSRADKYGFITEKIASGELPLRVTHNDTKLNNVLIDDATGRGACVIDLDTVMPGSVLYDFGDAIRFGASSAAEDEEDLSRVFVRLDLFEEFTRGFIRGLNNSLNESEILALPMGAFIMTLELCMRFLGDYLNGDVYFKTHRENHNLIRARNQIKLATDIEEKLPQLEEIVRRCGGAARG